MGRSTLQSASDRLQSINPHIEIQTYETRLNSENAFEILHPYDVIIDGTDNFPTRYLVNDACFLLGKPNVYGSIFRFDGQAAVFYAEKGPCYRCLYPEPPPHGLVPSCAEGGVLGVLPGIIGTLQATEALKLITGVGEPLIGLLLDALEMQFREMKLRKNPECPLCGDHATIRELIDYEAFCGIVPSSSDHEDVKKEEMTVSKLKQLFENGDDVFVLDVREQVEYQIANLHGYLIPLNDLPSRVHELDSARTIVVHCHYGTRSARAVEFLKQMGFKKVKNLAGGIDTWSAQIDPTIPRY